MSTQIIATKANLKVQTKFCALNNFANFELSKYNEK